MIAERDALLAKAAEGCLEHGELSDRIRDAIEGCDYLDVLAGALVRHSASISLEERAAIPDVLRYATGLRAVVDQCDRQRRRANWYEAGFEAGKAKLIESAVERATADLRAQLDKVRGDLDTMIKVHDEVERDRNDLRDRIDDLCEVCQEGCSHARKAGA